MCEQLAQGHHVKVEWLGVELTTSPPQIWCSNPLHDHATLMQGCTQSICNSSVSCCWCEVWLCVSLTVDVYSHRRHISTAKNGSDYGRRPTSTNLWFPWSYQCYGFGASYAYILSHTGICSSNLRVGPLLSLVIFFVVWWWLLFHLRRISLQLMHVLLCELLSCCFVLFSRSGLGQKSRLLLHPVWNFWNTNGKRFLLAAEHQVSFFHIAALRWIRLCFILVRIIPVQKDLLSQLTMTLTVT